MESAVIYEKQDERYPIKRNGFGSYQQYCYMVQKYTPQDFRYSFTQYYIQVLKARLNRNVYTCKIYYDPNLPALLNVVLYMDEPVTSYMLTQDLDYGRFHIRVDNSGIYQDRGSRFFFETEEYFNALQV